MQERESLKDLPGVTVLVERFEGHAKDAGFDRQTFQTDVELKLRIAEIKVTEDDWPWLYLNVNTLHRERNRSGAYNISLRLIQGVVLRSQLRSDLGKSFEDALATPDTFATTWSTELVGFGTVAQVRDCVRDLVDMFVNDWLAVNPLKGTM